MNNGYRMKAAKEDFFYNLYRGFAALVGREAHERWKMSEIPRDILRNHRVKPEIMSLEKPPVSWPSVEAALADIVQRDDRLLAEVGGCITECDSHNSYLASHCLKNFQKDLLMERNEVLRIHDLVKRLGNDPAGLLQMDNDLFYEYGKKYPRPPISYLPPVCPTCLPKEK